MSRLARDGQGEREPQGEAQAVKKKRAETETLVPSSATRIVWNPFLGLYLAQAPGRMHRRELSDECAFCADRTSGRVPADALTWIRPNDFPPFQPPQGECY